MLAGILVVVGGTAGLGAALGLGGTAVLAGLTALFCFLAASGGPLRPDLRLLAAFAPAVVVGGAGPRLLGEVSSVAAIALLVVTVFVAALLPALSPRFVTVGLGLGMASVFGYGFQLSGSASAAQIIGAPALAVGVVFVLRLLMGVGDPGKPTRAALADTMAGPDRGNAERAVRLWLADRPRAWQAQVFIRSMRAHGVATVLRSRLRALEPQQAEALTQVLDAVDERFAALAETVRAKQVPAELPALDRVDPHVALPGDTAARLDELWAALDGIRSAAAGRDESEVDYPRHLVREVLRQEAGGALSWRSAQLRHAVRCALGILVAVVIATLRPGDPLTVSFLMTTFAIMQPEWRDTLAKAWQRGVGAVFGAVVLGVALVLLPQSALLPLGIVALVVGVPFMKTQPMVFNACIVLMSVGVNATTRHLDAVSTLVEYLLLVVVAVAIGLLFGFAAVPGVPKPSVAQRFADAIGEAAAMLGTVAARLRGESDPRAVGLRFRAAARTTQDLLSPVPGSREPAPEHQAALEEVGDGLRGLMASSGALLQRGAGSPEMAGFADSAARALSGAGEPPAPPSSADEEDRLLADLVLADLWRVREGAGVLAAGCRVELPVAAQRDHSGGARGSAPRLAAVAARTPRQAGSRLRYRRSGGH
ncbi:fusaric acid resistance family protein [Amycolatopsis sulphurea]|uniref:Fusaric acid resistance family protein n=2 Tax=Amycolatopsis sulphurea TaxID=76022 RepID=A0A2A9FGL4_9PSEU|nr:fusaric acid resistance family protein [Amycolatopsis sulphurea]